MITNLPTGFVNSINATGRKPVQLAVLHIRGRTCHISDAPIGKMGGLQYDYEPLVESWGVLKDTSDIDQSFTGSSLEVRAMTLSLIVTGNNREFFLDTLVGGIENTFVELYQWFAENPAEPPVLIDILIAQDPISFSESSALFTMDLVSVIMRNNPYIWPRDRSEDTRDIVWGKVPNMPLFNDQTAKVTAISTDLTFDYVGPVYIDNGVGLLAGPNTVVIDSETVGYSWVTASTMQISSRGVNGTIPRPHIAGALIYNENSVFDYSICAGPVQSVTDLMGDGEPYVNDVQFLIDQDPVLARFYSRPPWLKLVPGNTGPGYTPAPEETSLYGSNTQFIRGEATSSAAGSVGNVNNGPTQKATISMNQPPIVGEQVDVITPLDVDQPYTAIPGVRTSILNAGEGPGTDEMYRLQAITPDELSTGKGAWSPSFATYTGPDRVFKSADWVIEFYTPGAYVSMRNVIQIDLTLKLIINVDGGDDIPLRTWTVNNYFNTTATTEAPWIVEGNYEAPNKFKVPFGQFLGLDKWDSLSNTSFRLELEYTRARIPMEPMADTGTTSYYYVDLCMQDTYIEVAYEQTDGSELVTFFPHNELSSHFYTDLSYLGGFIGVSAVIDTGWGALFNTKLTHQVIKRLTDDEADNTVVNTYQSTFEEWPYEQSVEVPLPEITSWTELANARVGIRNQFTTDSEGVNPTDWRTLEGYLGSVLWIINYQPGDIATSDEERIIYTSDLTCTVTSILGEDVTPPQVMEYLLTEKSNNGPYVDSDDFYKNHLEYYDAGYFFNGIMEGDIRLHEALKQCMFEGMCRFLFAEGAIKLLSYNSYTDPVVDFTIQPKETFLRSKSVKNQPVSVMLNDITILYDWNPSENSFESTTNASDSNSIARYEVHEIRSNMTMIRSDVIAELIAGYHLARKKLPLAVHSIDMFMSAYIVQKGDRVNFHTLSGDQANGLVAAIDRTIGQGKTGLINKFTIQIAEPTITYVAEDDGYGGGGYGVNGYGD